MSKEKMMYNDVVEDIQTVNISDKGGFDIVPVKLKLSVETIRKAHKIFKNKIHEQIDNLIYYDCVNTTTKPGELLYKGKPKIRGDVLRNLKAISDYFIKQSYYPFVKKSNVNVIIKEVLGDKDQRVYTDYINCIKHCIKSSTGKDLGYYQDVDISCFVKAVEEYDAKQHHLTSSSMEK